MAIGVDDHRRKRGVSYDSATPEGWMGVVDVALARQGCRDALWDAMLLAIRVIVLLIFDTDTVTRLGRIL